MKSSLLAYEVIKEEAAPQDRLAEKTETKPATSSGPAFPFLALGSSLFLGAKPLRVVAIVSCKPREGVTYVGCALRNFLISHLGFSAKLLDANECLDVRLPGESRFVGKSLSAAEREPSELLRSANLQDKVVLIDCPPLSSSAALVCLAPHVDGVLLVVEDGKRSKAEIDRAVSTIQAAQGQVVGIVLNKRQYVLPNWLFSLFNN